MKKYFAVLASFVIMLCLGGVYAWSVVAPELSREHGFSSAQSQSIFGLLIGILPVTMIFAGKVERRYGSRAIAWIAGGLFSGGYLLSGFSGGNFWLVLLGNGIFAGMGTGFGYLAALTVPVKLFPSRKGLVTGIAVGGFGLAAMALSYIVHGLTSSGRGILEIFLIVGAVYGTAIAVSAFFLKADGYESSFREKDLSAREIWSSPPLYKLISGFFLGTFAGLLIVGSLKPIGAGHGIGDNILILGVSVFAISNFAGRVSWGFVSDTIGASLTIFIALAFQAFFILLLGTVELSDISFLVLSMLAGFGFGGNFVLFAKETAEIYGVGNLGAVYPYVSFGYALGGLSGPVTGGLMYDRFGDYRNAACLAALISLAGALLFLADHYTRRERTRGS